MSKAAASSLPLGESDNRDEMAGKRSGGDPVRWKIVARMTGFLPARIVADRLQSEGIPARAWQESVGQAYGMVVGPLGTGYVSVPEEHAEAAEELLAESEADDDLIDAEED